MTKTITYTYDPLNRLTAADYSSGEYFHYTYDNAGNRLTEDKKTTPMGAEQTTSYTYDNANRMTYVNGVAYTWDANGNMLSDGTSTYAYDRANQLVSITSGSNITSFTYNGEGDQLTETTNGSKTIFILDLNAGLTQVLSDGTNTYAYGLGRISQTASAGTSYFLGDALGSVRQLTDGQGKETLAQWYEPYGDVLLSVGSAKSIYGYTGEMQDSYNGLVFLRARYYDSGNGIFTSHDPFVGNPDNPISFNGWDYVDENPINNMDSTGMITEDEANSADAYVDYLQKTYGVIIVKDWGYYTPGAWNTWITGSKNLSDSNTCGNMLWESGKWKSLDEIEWTKEGIDVLANGLGGNTKIQSAIGKQLKIKRLSYFSDALGLPNIGQDINGSFSPPLDTNVLLGADIIIGDGWTVRQQWIRMVNHEFGHVWDYSKGLSLSKGLMNNLGTWFCGSEPNIPVISEDCWNPYAKTVAGGSGIGQNNNNIQMNIYKDPGLPAGEPSFCTPETRELLKCKNPSFLGGKRVYALSYGAAGHLFEGAGWEDWAESLASYIYPEYYKSQGLTNLDQSPERKNYVGDFISSIP